MAERRTVARPFASALFRHGVKSGQLAAWQEVLNTLKAYCGHESLQRTFKDPRISGEQLGGLVVSLVSEQLPENGKNFIGLLADSGRLDLLPEIADLFAQLHRDHEKRADVTITSAREIGDGHKELISKAMERRLGRQVKITTLIDEAMVGGAIIRVGDQVIDGSMRGRLEQLSQQLGQ